MIWIRLAPYAIAALLILGAVAWVYDAGRDAEEGRQAAETMKEITDAVERSQPGPVLGHGECRRRMREGLTCAH